MMRLISFSLKSHNSHTILLLYNFSTDIPFSADQVRVLLFRECDFQGRKLLFDSSAIQKTDTQPAQGPPGPLPPPAAAAAPRAATTNTTQLGNVKPPACQGGGVGLNPKKKYTVSEKFTITFVF